MSSERRHNWVPQQVPRAAFASAVETPCRGPPPPPAERQCERKPNTPSPPAPLNHRCKWCGRLCAFLTSTTIAHAHLLAGKPWRRTRAVRRKRRRAGGARARCPGRTQSRPAARRAQSRLWPRRRPEPLCPRGGCRSKAAAHRRSGLPCGRPCLPQVARRAAAPAGSRAWPTPRQPRQMCAAASMVRDTMKGGWNNQGANKHALSRSRFGVAPSRSSLATLYGEIPSHHDDACGGSGCNGGGGGAHARLSQHACRRARAVRLAQEAREI